MTQANQRRRINLTCAMYRTAERSYSVLKTLSFADVTATFRAYNARIIKQTSGQPLCHSELHRGTLTQNTCVSESHSRPWQLSHESRRYWYVYDCHWHMTNRSQRKSRNRRHTGQSKRLGLHDTCPLHHSLVTSSACFGGSETTFTIFEIMNTQLLR